MMAHTSQIHFLVRMPAHSANRYVGKTLRDTADGLLSRFEGF